MPLPSMALPCFPAFSAASDWRLIRKGFGRGGKAKINPGNGVPQKRHASGSMHLFHMSTASTCRPPFVDFRPPLRHVSAVRWMYFVEPFYEQIEQARAGRRRSTSSCPVSLSVPGGKGHGRFGVARVELEGSRKRAGKGSGEDTGGKPLKPQRPLLGRKGQHPGLEQTRTRRGELPNRTYRERSGCHGE